MANVYNNVSELVGKTPLLELVNIERNLNLKAKILAKIEYFNPTGSIKDRAALNMIEDAEKKGLLKPCSVIIEPTSGNTGIGLAAIATSRGYKTMIVMPDSMSIERRKMMMCFCAEVVLTPGVEGMKGAIKKAEELHTSIPDSFIPAQFDNPANAEIHYITTGPEIFADTDGNVDIFVSGVGTGGTITGTGRYLKEKIPGLKIVAVEPDSSPVLSEKKAGSHKIQGIGAGFVPSLLDTSIYDEIERIKDEDAISFGKLVARYEGICVGISSGAALAAAVSIAQKVENEGKTIVVIFPDSGDRYLSTQLFD